MPLRKPLTTALQPTARPHSAVAPYDGLNTRDPLATLGESYAVILDNFYPTSGGVSLRAGSELLTSHTVDTIEFASLFSYRPAAGGADSIFAGGPDGIYDVTAGGTVSAPVTPGTDANWAGVNVTTGGGNFLWCCNGVDQARYYNGTAWTLLTAPALTGVTSTSIFAATVFKARLYLLCNNSLSFWYLPVNSIAGAAVEYPLQVLCSKGGRLVAIGTWTVDNSSGPNDYFAALTSEGQVVVYEGYDPSTANTWSLVGVFDIGAPLGRQPMTRVGGDLYILTTSGVQSLSALMRQEGATVRPLTSRIDPTFKSLATLYKDNVGWGICYHQRDNALLVNVPVGLGRSWQLVMNATTGAWCRFVGWDARVFAAAGDDLYFARAHQVYQAWDGTSDNGAAIMARCQTGYNYFRRGGVQHHIKLLRVNGNLTGTLPIQLGLAQDFTSGEYRGSLQTFINTEYLWDSAVWDAALWGIAAVNPHAWRTVFNRPGHSTALMLRVNAKGATFTWYSTNYILQQGGLL